MLNFPVLKFDHGETIDMLRESVRQFAAREIDYDLADESAARRQDAHDVFVDSRGSRFFEHRFHCQLTRSRAHFAIRCLSTCRPRPD